MWPHIPHLYLIFFAKNDFEGVFILKAAFLPFKLLYYTHDPFLNDLNLLKTTHWEILDRIRLSADVWSHYKRRDGERDEPSRAQPHGATGCLCCCYRGDMPFCVMQYDFKFIDQCLKGAKEKNSVMTKKSTFSLAGQNIPPCSPSPLQLFSTLFPFWFFLVFFLLIGSKPHILGRDGCYSNAPSQRRRRNAVIAKVTRGLSCFFSSIAFTPARAGNGPVDGGVTSDQSEASRGDGAHHRWLKKVPDSSCFQVTRLFQLLCSCSVIPLPVSVLGTASSRARSLFFFTDLPEGFEERSWWCGGKGGAQAEIAQ